MWLYDIIDSLIMWHNIYGHVILHIWSCDIYIIVGADKKLNKIVLWTGLTKVIRSSVGPCVYFSSQVTNILFIFDLFRIDISLLTMSHVWMTSRVCNFCFIPSQSWCLFQHGRLVIWIFTFIIILFILKWVSARDGRKLQIARIELKLTNLWPCLLCAGQISGFLQNWCY